MAFGFEVVPITTTRGGSLSCRGPWPTVGTDGLNAFLPQKKNENDKSQVKHESGKKMMTLIVKNGMACFTNENEKEKRKMGGNDA